MIHEGARQLPTQHISIRVPWHDSDWNGTVCKNPLKNVACRALKNIAEKKDEAQEFKIKGCKFSDLNEAILPPCFYENGKFMAPFPIETTKRHPYTIWDSPPELVEHFLPTTFELKPYTAECVPYRWLNLKESKKIVKQYELGFNQEFEPPGLDKKSPWIQERRNHLVMLETFYSAIKPTESLCFFYAKDTPLSNSPNRTIIGVGLVDLVGNEKEYKYSVTNPSFKSLIWERDIIHSIRSDFKRGFIFPYNEILKFAEKQGFDPEEYVAFAPNDAFANFSWGSEHVSNDHAISSILICIRSLEKINTDYPEFGLDPAIKWLNQQLKRLWKMRGAFPGFGSVLSALLGNEKGNLIAYDMFTANSDYDNQFSIDPWQLFEKYLTQPNLAPESFQQNIGGGYAKYWSNLPPERKEYLKLLSRFSLSYSQACRMFEKEKRLGGATDTEIFANPYRIFEEDREAEDPVSIATIDKGLQPNSMISKYHPLPEICKLTDNIDPRRVRALIVSALELGALQGHTLLSHSIIPNFIEKIPVEADCPIRSDVIESLGSEMVEVVNKINLTNGDIGFQLTRFSDSSKMIRDLVNKRLSSKKRFSSQYDFRHEVDSKFDELPKLSPDREIENQARTEKAEALAELYHSRFSVLVGSAGTGKTTLLEMLCDLGDVSSKGILLLAPTGKARMQIKKRANLDNAQTIAQFLLNTGRRYNPITGKYSVKNDNRKCRDYGTVIIDECSMLTEEQLASVIDALGMERLVLVGDPQQLPPIGNGRPFVDIVRKIKPENIEFKFPRVDTGYAELTIQRRQQGKERNDVRFANLFRNNPDSTSDDTWNLIQSNKIDEIRFESWNNYEELKDKLLNHLVKELNLNGIDDELNFERRLGATYYENNPKTYFWRNKEETEMKIEDWQIISPIRGSESGVQSLNQLIQSTFRKTWLAEAIEPARYKLINKPVIPHGIIYGDKVINLKNSDERDVYPERDSYVANGDIGLVVGSIKTKRNKKLFKNLKVEFASQPSFEYEFPLGNINSEGDSPPLDLAYVLTVHKTQGSEFGTTFVVLPEPCWLMSRELLYTALTRHKHKLIILYNDKLRSLQKYTRDEYSEIARRLTNIFTEPSPEHLKIHGREVILDKNMVHLANNGMFMQSKSELVIANELLSRGIEFEYEEPLPLKNGLTYFPKFTINDLDTGYNYYWEHINLQHNPKIQERWEKKLENYKDNQIFPREENVANSDILIITEESDSGGIDQGAVRDIITKHQL